MRGTKKSSQTLKSSKNFSEMTFLIYGCKSGQWWKKITFKNLQNFVKF